MCLLIYGPQIHLLYSQEMFSNYVLLFRACHVDSTASRLTAVTSVLILFSHLILGSQQRFSFKYFH
jgi:hypothetical protein